ncbi:MAG: hypothetical protein NTY20_04545 [Candidatus Aenigmarchaeota archaeon]|nr:hypothetical protein [Candidatus Aenigmarchaeota archaeon]
MKVILPLTALLVFAVLAGFSNAHCYPECFPNNPPSIAGLPDQTVMVGQSTPFWDLYTYASDTEDYYTDLMFSIDYQSNPSVINCYITGNRYVGCNNAQSAGYSDITVRVTDTGGLIDTDSFRITVQSPPPVNTPPMISGIPDYTVNAGQSIPSIDLFGYASDAQDSDSALVFSIDSQSEGSVISCSIASNRYAQCGTAQKAGFSDIIVRVTDTGGLSDTDSFRITVQSQPPANTPPVISGIPDLTINLGQTISLVDLFAYASDSQDPDTAFSFSIDSQSNPGVINCYITGNRYVGCGAAQSTGFSDVTVSVTDTGGLSSADTFRITVQSQPPSGDHAPVINSLRITPSSPEDTDTLTCTAQVSDQDGNLQSVQFRWLVDGALDRTRTIQVSGSSSTVQDTLDSSRSGLGDEVKCEAAAYDSTGLQDSDFDAVVIQRQDCGVDVLNLEVIDNNKIRFRIRNTGNSQQNINYKVYVDGGIIGESSVTLNLDELEIIQNSYSFGIGSFIVKVKATAQCGSTDSETIVHEVLNPCPETSSCPGPQPGNEDPVVDSVRITPSSPEEGDELTCRVELSDDEGDLDRVQLKWLVEGDLERTRTIYVSGSHDDVEDTLSSGWFNGGDEVRCEARVFDRDANEDSDSDVVTIGGEQGCGVDVYNLESIDNNEIRFRIRNTGQDTESINYKVYVESEVIIEHSISLDEDEWDSIEETFSFDIGDSIVKVKAKAECGSTDTEFLSIDGDHGICQKKYLDEYRCSGSWSQRKYQNSDCSSLWVNYESCSSGCSNGFCTGTGGQCGVSIQKFDYQTSIVAGNAAYVTLEARNTADRQETITLSLWVDGQLKESYPSTVSTGSTSLGHFTIIRLRERTRSWQRPRPTAEPRTREQQL